MLDYSAEQFFIFLGVIMLCLCVYVHAEWTQQIFPVKGHVSGNPKPVVPLGYQDGGLWFIMANEHTANSTGKDHIE